MKKILLSVLAVAAVAVSCQTEKLEEGTSQTGKTVKIVAELPETKTVFNPEDKTVAWEDDDELTVVVNSSSAYTFGKVAGENAFSASGVTLQDGQNTYHVLYPYNEKAASVDADGFVCIENGDKAYLPIPSNAAAAQKGINNADHVKGVIYGYTTAADSETPSVQMHQLTALLKIDVTNNHTEPIEVRSITVSTDAAGQLLSGTYYINLETGETESSGDKYTYNYTTLGVTNVTMEAGATGTFWVSAHPFSVPQGSKLTISVETDKGVSSDERTYESALEFAAGTVNTASFNFEAPEAIEKLTVAEFLAKEVGNVYYELTGTISNISNTEYGNFDLTDDTGTVYVYGLTATKVTSNDKSFSSLGLREGDVLTLVGTRAEYNGTAQVGGPAYYISHVAAPYCNVTPSTMSVTAEAGTTTFNIESNEYWMLESSNEAYTVSQEEGTGDAVITVTYPANEGTEPVEVVFTVLSNSGVEKTVTLTQRVAGQVIEPTELFISEYVEGSANNKYIEIYNPTSNTIDLSDYTLEIYSNGKTTSTSVKLEGSIESKTALVYANSNANLYEVPKERKSGSISFNGEKGDAIALSKNGVNIDVWGIIGSTADYGKDVTMRRNPDVTGPSAEFIESQWTTYSIDDVSDLGKHTMNE